METQVTNYSYLKKKKKKEVKLQYPNCKYIELFVIGCECRSTNIHLTTNLARLFFIILKIFLKLSEFGEQRNIREKYYKLIAVFPTQVGGSVISAAWENHGDS